MNEFLYTLIFFFCSMAVPLTIIRLYIWEIDQFIFVEMPGYLTCWQIDKQNISPLIFPVLAYMLLNTNFVTKPLSVLSQKSNTHIAFGISSIYRLLYRFEQFITYTLCVGTVKHTLWRLTPAHTCFN